MRAVIPFDSACWASGEAQTGLVHSSHLLNQRREDLLAITKFHADEETVLGTALSQPGSAICLEDTMTMTTYRQLALYRKVGCRLGLEQAMGIAISDPVSGLAEFFVLYRNKQEYPFTLADRAAVAILAPHITEAWRSCQFFALRQPERLRPDVAGAFLHGRAISDWVGTITQAETGFGSAVAAAFPGWSGTRLPNDLIAFIRSDKDSLVRGAFRFEIARGGQRHVISVLGSVRGNLLSGAELDVARRVAGGDSHVRIAAARGVSNATVRNQIARVYEKLSIHSKTELTQVLLSLTTG